MRRIWTRMDKAERIGAKVWRWVGAVKMVNVGRGTLVAQPVIQRLWKTVPTPKG